MKLRNIIISAVALLLSVPVSAQKWEVEWGGSANALAGIGEYLPFWARTGHDGIVPYSTSGLVTFGADVRYGDRGGWNFEAGTNLAGAVSSASPVSPGDVYGLVDRLYLSGSWKMLHLDLGMKPRERELSDLSVSGGNVVYSRNARNIPGINAWSDWIYFEKGHWVGVKGNFAHYQMIDNRYVKGAMIHNKAVSMKVALVRNVDLIAGFEHWAQWGGVSPKYGPQPDSLRDLWDIIFANRGGEDSTLSDQLNSVGNHLGREYVRLDWRTGRFTVTFQYDKPFEDGSGMKLQNVPDGIWSLQFAMNNREAWITDVIYEFISTTWQSGTVHDRPATEEEMAKQDPNSHYYGKIVIGGCDNYFGNSEYRSGWTNYNRVIGCPLLLPSAPGPDGITTSMASTRVRAHHVGVKGLAFSRIPYRFLATYSKNFGKYHQSGTSFFANTPQQLSLGLELEFGRKVFDLPIGFAVGAYGDFGELYQDSVGLTLRFIYGEARKF